MKYHLSETFEKCLLLFLNLTKTNTRATTRPETTTEVTVITATELPGVSATANEIYKIIFYSQMYLNK